MPDAHADAVTMKGDTHLATDTSRLDSGQNIVTTIAAA